MTPHQKRTLAVETQVLDRVRQEGGFSVFWATQSIEIARAIDRLHWKLGVIERRKGRGKGRFPWCGYQLTGKNHPQ
jgi:hypothetical protein